MKAELGKQFVQNKVKNANDVERFQKPDIQTIDTANNIQYANAPRGVSTSEIDITMIIR